MLLLSSSAFMLILPVARSIFPNKDLLQHVFRRTCAFIDQSFMHQEAFSKGCGIMGVGIFYCIIDQGDGLRGIIWMITVAVVTGY